MATLAARDQENAVRNVTIGPGGKPLAAGSKAFGAKTPGNTKTPYKVPLNDENVIKLGGKAKGAKVESSAFVTPAGPRTRAPLGLKTTNAKSKAFATPAPLTGKTQKVSPRLHRPKVKVHQPEPEVESDDDVPEVEYMPPKEIPLPFDMDDYLPREWSVPKMTPQEIAGNISLAYNDPMDDDGGSRKVRLFNEELLREKKKAFNKFDQELDAEMASYEEDAMRGLGLAVSKKEISKPKVATVTKRSATGISTLRARSAANALSSSAKPSFAASTAATKSRVPTGLISSKKTIKPLADKPAPRQALASTASKSTIGYAQGRAGRVAPAARKPLSNVTKPPPFSATARRAAPATTSRSAAATAQSRSGLSRSSSTATDATLVADLEEPEDQICRIAEVELALQLEDLTNSIDDDDEAWANSFNSQLHMDDDEDDFQFKIPEGL